MPQAPSGLVLSRAAAYGWSTIAGANLMTDGILLRETRGHIRILTINRPERSNAMSPELTEELIDAFVDGGADPDIRAIVLTAVGDRAFCAGADLKARAQADAAGYVFRAVFSRGAREFVVVGV